MMALVERHSEQQARQRHGSHESLAPSPTNQPSVPASGDKAQTPERRFSLERHPIAKLALKGAGIGALLLGLAGIGALSMKKGFGVPKLALADTTHPAGSTVAPGATHASLVGESASLPATNPSGTPAPSARSPGLTEDGRVILNLATVEDLRHLPGVGQKRAEAILALRQKLGKFKRPSDLLRIRGIGARRLKQLLPKFVVDAPAPAPTRSDPLVATATLPVASPPPTPSALPLASSAVAASSALAPSAATPTSSATAATSATTAPRQSLH